MATTNESAEKHKCVARLSAGHGAFWGLPCGDPAGYEHDGKYYCKTHYPPTFEATKRIKLLEWKVDLRSRIAPIDAADDELAAMRKDAARYRWLRDTGWAEPAIYATGPKEWGTKGIALLHREHLDGVIDGAIEESKSGA